MGSGTPLIFRTEIVLQVAILLSFYEGGGSESSSTPPPRAVRSVRGRPSRVPDTGAARQFTAPVSGAAATTVTSSVAGTGGGFTTAGLYTGRARPGAAARAASRAYRHGDPEPVLTNYVHSGRPATAAARL